MHRIATTTATWLLVALGMGGFAFSAWGIAAGGVGIDGAIDISATNQILALAPSATLESAYAEVYEYSEFYGVLVPQVAQLLQVVTGAGDGILAVQDLTSYRWIFAVSLVIATAGAAALAVAVGTAVTSRLAGAFTWGTLMTTPLWAGLAAVNYKDAPVAGGLSMLSAGLIFSHTCRRSWVRWMLGVTLTTIGAFVTVATRPAMWPACLLIALITLLIYAWITWRDRQLRRLLPTAGSILIAGTATVFLLAISNPIARMNVLQWLGDSVATGQALADHIDTWANGEMLDSSDLPLWYVPGWLLAQLPIPTIAAGALATLMIVASVSRRPWSIPRRSIASTTPLFAQGVVIPALLVASGAALYDGIRHLLFILPALIGIFAIGIAGLQYWADTGAPWRRWVPPVSSVAVGVSGIIAISVWFPYQYAYINPIAGWNREDPQWDLDYWGLSSIEGVERIQDETGLPVVVQPFPMPALAVGGIWMNELPEGTDSYGVYLYRRWGERLTECDRLFTITRAGYILGEGGVCKTE